MSDRMGNRKTYINSKKIYKHLRDARGNKKFIKHYGSPDFKELTVDDISAIDIINEEWKTGSKLYKFAHKYYNDSTLWWVIALFNQKPTDSHFSAGDVVYIPFPLEQVLAIYGM